jgi:hypothetical protein
MESTRITGPKLKIETIADVVAQAAIRVNERDKGNKKLFRYLCNLAQRHPARFTPLLLMMLELELRTTSARR